LVKLKCPYQISVLPGAILQWRHYTRAEELPPDYRPIYIADCNFGNNRTTDLPSLIADRRHSLFGYICRLSLCSTPASQAQHLSIDTFTGTPLAADWKRPPWVVHRELGFNRWKKIWVYLSVPVISQPWRLGPLIMEIGDRYDI